MAKRVTIRLNYQPGYTINEIQYIAAYHLAGVCPFYSSNYGTNGVTVSGTSSRDHLELWYQETVESLVNSFGLDWGQINY